jgi:N-glycosylase/DNA lyase
MLQVLFTADLKSFSSYGLPSPSSPAISAGAEGLGKEAITVPPTPPLTPSPSPIKRKRVREVTSQLEQAVVAIKDEVTLQPDDSSLSGGASSLADRVKKRRRVTVSVTTKL